MLELAAGMYPASDQPLAWYPSLRTLYRLSIALFGAICSLGAGTDNPVLGQEAKVWQDAGIEVVLELRRFSPKLERHITNRYNHH